MLSRLSVLFILVVSGLVQAADESERARSEQLLREAIGALGDRMDNLKRPEIIANVEERNEQRRKLEEMLPIYTQYSVNAGYRPDYRTLEEARKLIGQVPASCNKGCALTSPALKKTERGCAMVFDGGRDCSGCYFTLDQVALGDGTLKAGFFATDLNTSDPKGAIVPYHFNTNGSATIELPSGSSTTQTVLMNPKVCKQAPDITGKVDCFAAKPINMLVDNKDCVVSTLNLKSLRTLTGLDCFSNALRSMRCAYKGEPVKSVVPEFVPATAPTATKPDKTKI